MPLKSKDFKYYKEWIHESEKEHAFMKKKNLPKHVIAAYEGRLGNYGYEGSNPEVGENEFELTGDLIEDYLIIAVNTILPSMFHKRPRPQIKANPGGSPFSAAILEELARHYFDDKAKKENQKSIIDAYLPYGYGVVKVGYNSRRGKLPQQKPSFWTGKTKSGKTEEGMEASLEFLKYEGAFLERVSPMNAILDHTKEFGKGTRITLHYQRTLDEVIKSNLYNLSTEFLTHFRPKGDGDNRKVKLTLKEHWIMIDGFAWKLVYIEDWHEELAWGRSVYTELPVSLLRFNHPSDTLYATSHGRLAYAGQKELNYLNKIWKEHIDKCRRQHLVDSTGLTPEGRKTLLENEIDGVVFTDRPVTQGVYQAIGAQPMNADVYSNIETTRSYLNLLLSTTGGKGGEPDPKLAIVERAKAFGDLMRTSGMQDDIADFTSDQLRKMIIPIVKFGDPEITIKITQDDIVDPANGELVTGKELSFGGGGFTLKDEIQGKLELDYQYTMDVVESARPDFAVVRKQLDEFVARAMNALPIIKSEGKTIEFSGILESWADTFTAIPNLRKRIRNMTDEEKVAFQKEQQMMMQMEAQKQASKGNPSPPTEEKILQGAQSIQTRTEAL